MRISYREFITQMRRRIWPATPGEPHNLVELHDTYFLEVMIELQKWVPCLQENNTSVFPFCSTYVDEAKSWVNAPDNGVPYRVYTIANDEWDDKVFYDSWNFREMEQWVDDLKLLYVRPVNVGLPALPGGNRFADESTDIDDGRAMVGAWAIHRRRLYIAPWIQSNESIVLEWDGVRTDWNDSDIVDTEKWSPDVQELIRLGVQLRDASRFGCDKEQRKAWQEEFDGKLSDLIWWCKQKTEQQVIDVGQPVRRRDRTYDEVSDDAVPEDEDEQIVIANIGEFGDPTNAPNPANVADLVIGWAPAFILSGGANNDGTTYAAAVGAIYEDYLAPNMIFYPAAGKTDWDVDGTLAAFLAYFGLDGLGRSYHEVVSGPVHMIFADSDSRNSGGVSATSKQALWVKAKLALSTAKWKIVVISNPPYSSDSVLTPGFAELQWPFGDWGADLVISGRTRSYERLEVGGVPYVVNGSGGAGLGTFGAPVSGSAYRSASYGAGRITVDCDSLKYEFIGVDGTILDTLEL